MSALPPGFRSAEWQQRVAARQRIWRTRRLLAVIRIDGADLLTFAAEGAYRSGQIIVGTMTAFVFKPGLGWWTESTVAVQHNRQPNAHFAVMPTKEQPK